MVEMEDIDEQLRINICSILNSVSEETINGIIHALKYAGLESLSDLQFVQEDDLILVLKPIQRRKLIKAWSEQQKSLDQNMSKTKDSGQDKECQEINQISNAKGSLNQNLPEIKESGQGKESQKINQMSNAKDIPAVKLLSHSPLKKCRWGRQKNFILLQAYARYKIELEQPNTEKHEIWKKISDEVEQRSSSNCDELQCMAKIESLKKEYENIKRANSVSKKKVAFFLEAKDAFEISENSANIPAVSGIVMCSWNGKKSLRLLQVYTKYKKEFSYPEVNELIVWKKIAEELRVISSLRCSELECCNKIDELRLTYERIKTQCIANEETAVFMDKARKAFETNEAHGNIYDELSSNTPLLSIKKRKPAFRSRLLEVYANYKNEFSCSNVEEIKIWDKIANEIREKYFYDCGPYLCRFEVLLLKPEYIDIKGDHSKKVSSRIDINDRIHGARKGFETNENLDALNSQINEIKKIDRYIPPHLRNGGNKPGSIMFSKTDEELFTIKVCNLSRDAKQSDLKELFSPYGTINRIYMIKDKTGLFKGFAFIKFHKTEDAVRAIETTNGIEYNKSILKVEWAQKTELKEYDHASSEKIMMVNKVPSLPPFQQAKPSNFNLNDFKKIYSDESKSVSIKYFWDNFDAENYSIWYCEYLYTDELSITSKNFNLTDDMFQKLCTMHKNVFASMCIFGDDNYSTISGIWVWRGHEIAFTLSSEWQQHYKSFNWEKLDPSSDETRKLVKEYFTWSGEFGGKKFNRGKILK